MRNTSLATIAFGIVLGASCASSQDGFGDGDGSTGDDNSTNPTDDSGCGFSCGDVETPPNAFCGTSGTPCNDFPTTPVLDTNTPSNAASLFSGQGTAAGPCLVEPEDGSLFPRNWVRPRFLFTAAAGQNLFEITVHTAAEANDLVIYTSNTSFKLDPKMWSSLTVNAIGETITVSVRGVSSSGGTPSAAASSSFTIAPVTADGAMVYWTTASFDPTLTTNTSLEGFHIGDEGVTTALTAAQVQGTVRAGPVDGGNISTTFQSVGCIGCHTATPDGNYVAFTTQWPWASTLASVQADAAVGAVPPWLSEGAIQNLSPDDNMGGSLYGPPAVNQIMLGIQSFSKAHYMTGDRVLISQIGASWNSTGATAAASLQDPGSPTGVPTQLIWVDLEWNPAGGAPTDGGGITGLPMAPCGPNAQTGGTNYQACVTAPPSNGGWGMIKRTGDSRGAASPSWSHDGNTIAYSSTDVGTKDGRVDCAAAQSKAITCLSDVYTVPYNNRAGGTATGLGGASDPAYNEYYPAFSSDDALIAFNRVPANHSMYNTPEAEVDVVSAAGSPQATRLKANDPVACTGVTAIQSQNTWPKFGPKAVTGPDGKIYYWLTFSSTRSPVANHKAQLYVTAIVVDPSNGNMTTYPSIYLWNQDPTLNNLIPAWEDFSIPPGKMMVQ